MVAQQRSLFFILLSALSLLLLPLIAMQFTTEVNWTLSDFMIMGVLLLSAGLLGELVFRKIRKSRQRIALFAAILVAFVLIWAELAVGIFGTPFSGS
jgi:chromate transport protein ChrA